MKAMMRIVKSEREIKELQKYKIEFQVYNWWLQQGCLGITFKFPAYL